MAPHRGRCGVAGTEPCDGEHLMASKDKGGRATKTTAAKSPKEKKAEKAAKKSGKSTGSSS